LLLLQKQPKTMKKLFLLAAMAIGFAFNASAQSNDIKVVNNTNCDVHFELMGGPKGSCSITSIGPMTTLSCCGSSLYYANPTAVPMPGLGASDVFLAALVYDMDAACGTPTYYKIGEPCTGYPASQPYVTVNNDCKKKCVVKATYSTGLLQFN
jgi:hypothetical protein